jgi:hypothetical protein
MKMRAFPLTPPAAGTPVHPAGCDPGKSEWRDWFQISYREILRDYDALPGYLHRDQTSQARFSILFELLKKIAAI